MHNRRNIVWDIIEHKWDLLRKYNSIKFKYPCRLYYYMLDLSCAVKYNDTNIADCVDINSEDVPVLFYK